MSDINTYADEAAITGLTPINGDLVLNRGNNSLYLCTDSSASGINRWKKFASDAVSTAPVSGYSIEFDGVSSYMQIPKNLTASTWTAQDWSFSMFIKPDTEEFDTSDTTTRQFLSGSGSNPYLGFRAGKFMYIDRYALLKYGPDLTDDWFHIMLVHNSLAADPYSATSIYYDGVFFGYTRTWSSNSQGIQYLGRNSSNNSFAKAKIDEVSLFDEQKDPSDVRSEDGKPLDLTNLNPFGWWRMGDAVNGSGGSVPNQGIGIGWPGVSNHIDATLYNTPTFTTDTPG